MRASRRFLNRPIQTHQTDAAEPFFAPAQQTGVQAESEDAFFDQVAPQPPKGAFANGTVQTKLAVNAPGDKHEQEADAMADQVVQRMSAPEEEKDKVHKKGKPEEEEKVQRMSAPEEEKDKVHKKGKPEEEEPLQRKCAECEKEEGGQVQRQSDGSSTAPSGVTQQIKSSKGQGSKLSDDTRTQMESSFGTDFSNVTIHTDHESTEMNNALHAQAFTHGSDIYFNEGKYNPQNTEGGRLLAHELTHVVQQNQPMQKIQKQAAPAAPVPAALPDHLTHQQEISAIRFNRRKFRDRRAIRGIQTLVGATADGSIGQETVERIAEFQSNNPPLTTDGQVGEATLRAMVAQLNILGNQNDAIFMIIDFFNFSTRGLTSIQFDPTEPANASTSGNIPGPSTVLVGPAGFAQSFEGLVHTIQHELEHVRQRRIGISNQNEREFLGEAVEIMSVNTPEEDFAGFIDDADRALRQWNNLPVRNQRRLWSRFTQVRRQVRQRFSNATIFQRVLNIFLLTNYNNVVRP